MSRRSVSGNFVHVAGRSGVAGSHSEDLLV